MKNYIFNKILSFFLILQIVFVSIISKYPESVEKFYSNGIYIAISGFLRRLLGWIPLSIGDLIYALLFFFVLRWLRMLYITRLSPFRKHLYTAGAFISILFFVFNLFWGFNYYRVPFYKKLGFENLEYTQEDLIKTTEKHITKLNFIHSLIIQNDSTVIEIPYKRTEIYKKAKTQYNAFYLDSIDLHFTVKSNKTSLISLPMCYMGFSGYLNPFTGEAQVNRKIPKSGFPATTSHELAHQLGYASESEANYIGYLACMQNEDLYFQYSAELMAVRYLLHAIYKENEDLYQKKYKKLGLGIQKDIQISHDFWDSYQTPLEPIFKKIYDSYLKANRQKDGIDSYSGFVGYLVKENN